MDKREPLLIRSRPAWRGDGRLYPNVGATSAGHDEAAYDAASLALGDRVKRLANGCNCKCHLHTGLHPFAATISSRACSWGRGQGGHLPHNGAPVAPDPATAEGVEVDFLPWNDKGELLLEEVPAHLSDRGGVQGGGPHPCSNICAAHTAIGAGGSCGVASGGRLPDCGGISSTWREQMCIAWPGLPGTQGPGRGPRAFGLMVVTDAGGE